MLESQHRQIFHRIVNGDISQHQGLSNGCQKRVQVSSLWKAQFYVIIETAKITNSAIVIFFHLFSFVTQKSSANTTKVAVLAKFVLQACNYVKVCFVHKLCSFSHCEDLWHCFWLLLSTECLKACFMMRTNEGRKQFSKGHDSSGMIIS